MRRGFNCKVVFLGDTSVGKSCLTTRFLRNEYLDYQEPTIGAAFLSKNITYQGRQLNLEIWDTAGQERYRSLAPMYYRGAKVAVVVYDITQQKTWDGAERWVNELRENHPNCIIILAGNKCDLEHDRTIDEDVVKEYITEHNLIHLETSAKTGYNVEEMVNIICQNAPITERNETQLVPVPKRNCC
jgi:small GTP-binding protein